MPFPDDYPIPEEPKTKFKIIVLILSMGLFIISLFNIGFCTDNNCRTSMEALLIGWLAMLTGGAAISWLANPFLVIAWVLMTKNKKSAWIYALISLFFSAIFLGFNVVIQNEAGHYNAITRVGLGYWLWLASCSTTFIGCLAIRFGNYRNSERQIMQNHNSL